MAEAAFGFHPFELGEHLLDLARVLRLGVGGLLFVLLGETISVGLENARHEQQRFGELFERAEANLQAAARLNPTLSGSEARVIGSRSRLISVRTTLRETCAFCWRTWSSSAETSSASLTRSRKVAKASRSTSKEVPIRTEGSSAISFCAVRGCRQSALKVEEQTVGIKASDFKMLLLALRT